MNSWESLRGYVKARDVERVRPLNAGNRSKP